jgi:hypothetical protein
MERLTRESSVSRFLDLAAPDGRECGEDYSAKEPHLLTAPCRAHQIEARYSRSSSRCCCTLLVLAWRNLGAHRCSACRRFHGVVRRSSDHSDSLAQRFGGWFVTGSSGPARHMGNDVVALDGRASRELVSVDVIARRPPRHRGNPPRHQEGPAALFSERDQVALHLLELLERGAAEIPLVDDASWLT